MIEEKSNYQPLFVSALLICAGLISPSNGVDDRTYKTPSDMLGIVLVAIIAGVVTFSIVKIVRHYGLVSNTQTHNKNQLNNNK